MARNVKMFETPQILEEKVKGYFDYCDKVGKPYTYLGMCIFIGCHKSTLTPYRKLDGYREVLEFASMRFENFAEEGILKGTINVTGGIFSLKNNFGWTDKREEKTTSDGKINISFNRKDSNID